MRVLVTGAAGFVGRHLVARLLHQHEVVAVVRTSGADPSTTIAIDLADPQFPRALPASVDAIVHLAQGAGTFPADALSLFDVNVSSTARLADYAVRSGARTFILASTGSVYAPSRDALTEDSPVAADTYYAATKLAAENLLSAYRSELTTTALRMFVPYGPGQSGRMIPSIVDAVLGGRPVIATNGGEPRSNPIFVDDLCEVTAVLLERPYPGTLNVGGPKTVSIRDIASIAADETGRTAVVEERESLAHRNLIANTERLHEHVPDFSWTSPEAGIRRMVGEGLKRA